MSWDEANRRIGSWLSAALDDPAVCEERKADIRVWLEASDALRAEREGTQAMENALQEIADRHIGDCPAALAHLSDEEWTRRCYAQLRRTAREALAAYRQAQEARG